MYNEHRDFQTKVLSTFFKDVILFGMTCHLITLDGFTAASVIKCFVSSLRLFACYELYYYVISVNLYHRDLVEEIRNIDSKGAKGALKQVLSHPLRRLVTILHPRIRTEVLTNV